MYNILKTFGLTWSLCGHDFHAKPQLFGKKLASYIRLSRPLLHIKPLFISNGKRENNVYTEFLTLPEKGWESHEKEVESREIWPEPREKGV